MIRRIVGIITLSVVNLFIGCEDVNHSEIEPLEFKLESGLHQDANGFYHLKIDTSKWQTIHRISGKVLRNNNPVNIIKFGWVSTHFWTIGDTLGYVVENTGNNELWYVGYDTTYITWFDGYEVPIVNQASYSNENGEVNTMIAPVKTMIGDTATIHYGYWDNWRYEDTYGEFNIIFD